MAWQVLAIWAIVLATIVWFVRDERRLRAEAALKRAAAYYAHAPQYQSRSTQTVTMLPPRPPRRTGGLSATQRRFLAGMLEQRQR